MNKIKSNKGFTIIEVVLVLAIAGLIFLMVFVALPNLQRSQRDTQRRDDYSQFAANITSYMTNNSGKLPTESTKLPTNKYINSTGLDPNGNPYAIFIKEASDGIDEIGDGVSGYSTTSYQIFTNSDECNAAKATADASPSTKNSECSAGDGGAYMLEITTEAADGTFVYLYIGADCSGTSTMGQDMPKATKSARAYAIYGDLETGSYCQAG